jgi:hypothetical protein
MKISAQRGIAVTTECPPVAPCIRPDSESYSLGSILSHDSANRLAVSDEIPPLFKYVPPERVDILEQERISRLREWPVGALRSQAGQKGNRHCALSVP